MSNIEQSLPQYISHIVEDLREIRQSVKDLTESVSEQNRKFAEMEEIVHSLANERKSKAEFWSSIGSTVIGTGIVGVLAAIGTAVWFYITHFIKDVIK